jgi:thiol-disulfide isomerase/thioredoxin
MLRPLFVALFVALVCAPLPAQDATDPVAQALKQGSVFESKRKYDLALDSYRKADKLSHHTSAVAYLHIAGVEKKQGQFADSLDDAKKAEKAAGSDNATVLQALMLRATILVQMSGKPTDKKLKEAEEELRRAVALSPNEPLCHFNLGFVLLKQGRDAEGIPELKVCVDSPRTDPSTREEAQRIIANPVRAREPFAPDFSFRTLEEKDVSSAGLRGRVLLMDFWGTWCAACREAIPMLRSLHKKYASQSFQLVGVSSDDDEDLVRTFTQAQHMDWLEHVDLTGKVLEAFKVESFPTFVVIDKDGVIRFRQSGWGPSTQNELEEAIGKALKRPSNPALAAAATAPESKPAEDRAVSAHEKPGEADASSAVSPLSEIEAWTISANVYSNKALGLTYELPKGWIAAKPEAMHRTNERAEAATNAAILQQHPEFAGSVGVSVPKIVLYASRKGEGDGQKLALPCIRVTAQPSRMSALSLSGFQRMTEYTATAVGGRITRPAAAFTVKDHDFLRADLERSAGSSKVAEALVHTLAGDYLLQIEIFASSQEELDKIADSLQSMIITDSDP